MKTTTAILLWVILAAACAPTATPIMPTAELAPQPVTPVVPAGASFFEGCTHMVGYPPQLTTDGAGILFEAQDPQISFYIGMRRRMEAEQGLSLEQLVSGISKTYGSRSHSQDMYPVVLTDFLGQRLKGFVTDIETPQRVHVRLMVFIRPDTFLMDRVKDDVVYELVAQAPEGVWAEWEPRFEIMFQSFNPMECGEV